jgi:hypothetical protein
MKQRTETAEAAGKSRGNSLLVSVLSAGKQQVNCLTDRGQGQENVTEQIYI